jgi:hypothetical protein
MRGKIAEVNGELELAKLKCDELENLARAYRNYEKVSKISKHVMNYQGKHGQMGGSSSGFTSSITVGYAVSSGSSFMGVKRKVGEIGRGSF